MANAGTITFMNWIEDMLEFKMINTEESAYTGEMGYGGYSAAQQKNREWKSGTKETLIRYYFWRMGRKTWSWENTSKVPTGNNLSSTFICSILSSFIYSADCILGIRNTVNFKNKKSPCSERSYLEWRLQNECQAACKTLFGWDSLSTQGLSGFL